MSVGLRSSPAPSPILVVILARSVTPGSILTVAPPKQPSPIDALPDAAVTPEASQLLLGEEAVGQGVKLGPQLIEECCGWAIGNQNTLLRSRFVRGFRFRGGPGDATHKQNSKSELNKGRGIRLLLIMQSTQAVERQLAAT